MTGLRFPHPISWYLQLKVDECGSLRNAAKVLGISHPYLWRLIQGDKKRPNDALLEKLGLDPQPYYIRK